MFVTRRLTGASPGGPCVSPGTTPHCMCFPWGVATCVCPAGGLCVSHSQKILCFPLLALSLFLCRFRGCPFCCCWRVTRNGSEWFSEVTVSVMQVMLEGPSVPSGGVTAPCPSPALVTPHGWLPLPFLLPCSAPGFVVLQEGRATSSDSSPLVSSPSVVSEQWAYSLCPCLSWGLSTPVSRSCPRELGPRHRSGKLGPPSSFRPTLWDWSLLVAVPAGLTSGTALDIHSLLP